MRVPFILLALLIFSNQSFGQNSPVSNSVDSTDYFIVKEIILSGNKVTKENIMLRELSFQVGDSIPKSRLEEELESSRNNLINSSLFNFVTITKEIISSTEIIISIQVQERWYFWGSPIFELAERNFNDWWEDRSLTRTNYGLYFAKKNFRGRKENHKLKMQLGFEQKISLDYSIPYLTKKQTAGMVFGMSYRQNHEVNYITEDNKQVFYKDKDNFSRIKFSTYLQYLYRDGIYNRHTIGLSYENLTLLDTIALLNPNYFVNGSFLQFLELSYYFRRDRRDNKAYPLEGYYFDFRAKQHGLGIFENDLNVLFLVTAFKKYYKLSDRFFIAGSIKFKASNGTKQPYYLNNGLGYRTIVRAYEYNVIDGQHVGLYKMNLKFNVIKPTTKKMRWPKKMDKFTNIHYAMYLNLFTDGGYALNRDPHITNLLDNTFLIGGGLGLDYVTYYDKILRIELSMNKTGKSGVYFHFIAPI